MIPKGRLIIIGGKEDKSENDSEMKKLNNDFSSNEILENIARDKKDRIEVITSATSEPESTQKDYQDTFDEIGYEDFGFIHFTKDQPINEDDLERLRAAKTIFFTGGDQERLYDALCDESIMTILKDKYFNDENCTIAGTSAGAMCIPQIMITNSLNAEAIIGDDIEIKQGLGLISNCIVDTHFVSRGRCSRLTHAILLNQELWGLGLGEDTALIIEKGTVASCIGSGMTVVISVKELGKTNIEFAEKGKPVYAENLKMHMLVKGCSIDLESGTMQADN